jgi:CheY-like chemotaxis protein
MSKAPKALFNLQRTSIMLADADHMGQSIMGQMLNGFGARNVTRCDDIAEIRRTLGTHTFDLIILDPASFGPAGYELTGWIRRAQQSPNRHVSVLIATGHTETARVGQLRDSGANFVVSKPLSAAVLLERVLWLSREKRPYVETPTYVGPDRRWHDASLPEGMEGRRVRDKEMAARIAAGGEMNQADIDSIMSTQV